jgi:hypothetical protein
MRGLYDDWNPQPVFPQLRENAQPVEARHDQIKHHGIDVPALVIEHGDGSIAGLCDEGLVAELAHHIVEESALHGIVIDDQDSLTHTQPRYRVPNWGNVADLG